MEKELPKRKHPRLANFDYGSAGTYFVTICIQNRQCLLSHIVGRGLAPAEIKYEVQYTEYGRIAEQQLMLLEKRYPYLEVYEYVIMPNHIHAIFWLHRETKGASPRPTVEDIVCAYKSLTTRECRQQGFKGKLFQNSFYEHIVRNQEDFAETAKYIRSNPIRWAKHAMCSEKQNN